jgi:hypothetical protein
MMMRKTEQRVFVDKNTVIHYSILYCQILYGTPRYHPCDLLPTHNKTDTEKKREDRPA